MSVLRQQRSAELKGQKYKNKLRTKNEEGKFSQKGDKKHKSPILEHFFLPHAKNRDFLPLVSVKCNWDMNRGIVLCNKSDILEINIASVWTN